jgi:hypothetical protein
MSKDPKVNGDVERDEGTGVDMVVGYEWMAMDGWVWRTGEGVW